MQCLLIQMFAHTFDQRTPTKIQMLYRLISVNALSNLSCFKTRSIFSIFMANLFLNHFILFPNNPIGSWDEESAKVLWLSLLSVYHILCVGGGWWR